VDEETGEAQARAGGADAEDGLEAATPDGGEEDEGADALVEVDGESGADATAPNGGSDSKADATVDVGSAPSRDGGRDSSVADDAAASSVDATIPLDRALMEDAAQDSTVPDDGNDGSLYALEEASGDGSNGNDAGFHAMDGNSAVPAIECIFGNVDSGSFCAVTVDSVDSSETGWIFKGMVTYLSDGGSLWNGGGDPTVSPLTDATPGVLEWITPFTGPDQTSEILLWLGLNGVIDVTNRVIIIHVQGPVPVTSAPNNPTLGT